MRDGRGRFFRQIFCFYLFYSSVVSRLARCIYLILVCFFDFFCPGLIGDMLVRGWWCIVLYLHRHVQYIEGGRPLLDGFIGRLPNLHDFKRGTLFIIAQDQRRISLDLVSGKELRLGVRTVGLRAFWGIDSMRRTTAGTWSTEHNVSTLKRKQASSGCLFSSRKRRNWRRNLVGLLLAYLSLKLFFDHRHSAKIRRFRYLNISCMVAQR